MSAQARPPALLSTGQLLRLSVLWLGLEFFWVSQQFMVMSERVEHFVPVAHKLSYLGLIKGCGAIVVVLTQLTVGFISDHAESRLGRRRPFIIYGVLWGCAAIAFFIFAPTYWWLFAAYMLIEATINVASIPFQSLLPDLVPERQVTRAGAMMGLMNMTGYLVGLLVMIAASVAFGDTHVVLLGDTKPASYLMVLGAYLVVLLTTATIVVLSVDEHGWAQTARTKLEGAVRGFYILPGTVVRFARTAPTLLGCIVRDYLKIELRSQPNFVWLAASRFTIYLGFQTFLTYVYFYVNSNLDLKAWEHSVGLPALPTMALLAMIMLSFVFGGFVGNVLSAPIAERRSKRFAIAAGMALAGVMLVPLILTRNVWMAMACGCVLGAGWGCFIASDWAFACTLMPKLKAGSYMGMWDVTTLIPQVLAPVIGGPIGDAVFGANLARLTSQLGPEAGQRAAEALSHQWLYATIFIYFIAGLLLLTRVRERRASAD